MAMDVDGSVASPPPSQNTNFRFSKPAGEAWEADLLARRLDRDERARAATLHLDNERMVKHSANLWVYLEVSWFVLKLYLEILL
jgi:hypothetical protein